MKRNNGNLIQRIGFVSACVMGLIGMSINGGCSESQVAIDVPNTPEVPSASEMEVLSPADANGAMGGEVVVPSADSPVAKQESEPVQEGGVLKTAGELFQKAKSGTGASAMGAKDWVQDKLGGAADASSEAAGDTMKWANDTFQSLKDKGLTTATDTSDWLNQDWKNMQSWQYNVVTLENSDTMNEELNKMGAQGWECFHIEKTKFYFKKPSDSYLRHIPFKEYIKLVPLLQGKK